MIFDTSAFGTPVISNNKQKLTLVIRYMEYLTQVLVRMTPQKAVLSGLRSCAQFPHGSPAAGAAQTVPKSCCWFSITTVRL